MATQVLDKPQTGQSQLSKMSKNGKVHSVLHTVPAQTDIDGSYSVSMPQFDEGAERLASANKIVDVFIERIPEAFRGMMTSEARDAMVAQELEKLPQGTGEAGRREYMARELPNVVNALGAQLVGTFDAIINGMVGLDRNLVDITLEDGSIRQQPSERIAMEVSKTGKSLRIYVETAKTEKAAGDGTRTKKATVKPSEASPEQFAEQLPKGIREISDSATRETYTARWTALVTQVDSFDRMAVQHYLVDNGHWVVARDGNRNWYPQTLGNKTVDKQADVIIATDETARVLNPSID